MFWCCETASALVACTSWERDRQGMMETEMQDKTVFLAHLSGQRTAGPPWTSRHAGEASTRLPSLHQLPSPPV